MAANGPTNGRLSAPTHATSTSFDALCGNMANGDSPPDYKPGGSAGLPVTKAENADGRKQLLNGMHRMHRIMTEEELAQGKQPRWTELEIHGRVKNVSPGLWQMTSLTALFLNGNALTRIPNEISHLVNLTMLDLSFNKLRSLPAELGDMISLCHLYLNSNLLRVLPYELGKLFRLQTLGLQGNPLSPELSKIYSEPNGQQKVLQFLLDHLAIGLRTATKEQLNEAVTSADECNIRASLQKVWNEFERRNELMASVCWISMKMQAQPVLTNGVHLEETYSHEWEP